MAAFKFRARELLNLHANEGYILQSFVRTWIDLLNVKSHIIHVLKSAANNGGLKSNHCFLVNKKPKKIAPPFHWPRS